MFIAVMVCVVKADRYHWVKSRNQSKQLPSVVKCSLSYHEFPVVCWWEQVTGRTKMQDTFKAASHNITLSDVTLSICQGTMAPRQQTKPRVRHLLRYYKTNKDEEIKVQMVFIKQQLNTDNVCKIEPEVPISSGPTASACCVFPFLDAISQTLSNFKHL